MSMHDLIRQLKEPNKTKIGKITLADCKKIAKEKEKDLNCFDLDQGARIIAGQARSMGMPVAKRFQDEFDAIKSALHQSQEIEHA